MRGQEGVTLKFSTQSTQTFHLDTGGIFVYDVCSGAWNSASLLISRLGPDGVTYLGVLAALLANSAATYAAPLYLPPGFYEATVSVGTPTDPIFFRLTRVPGE